MDDVFFDAQLTTSALRLAEEMKRLEISLYLTGLAASGKTAIAAMIAQMTGIPLVDSGLPFRLAALLCTAMPLLATDLGMFERLLNAHTINVVNGEHRVLSGHEDITGRLRTPEIDRLVPRLASDPKMREIILRFLRSTTSAPAIIAARGATEPLTGGRLLQIELRADFDVRVRRRVQQTKLPANTIRRSMRERDERDGQGPSRYPSSDSIDTSHLTLEATLARVLSRALERIGRLFEYKSFRTVSVTDAGKLANPFLARAWTVARGFVDEEEKRCAIPTGQCKARFLLHLSRFAPNELVVGELPTSLHWQAGAVPPLLDLEKLAVNEELLRAEARRIALEGRDAVDQFLELTKISPKIFIRTSASRVRRKGGHIIAEDDGGAEIEQLELRDASPELGWAIERHLHYLASPREGSTHQIVLTERSSDLPVLYLSFSSTSRRYLEPLLWAFGLRMEEVAVAVRGYGSPRAPHNAMALFIRLACKRVSNDYPHLKCVLTDINPNWGFSGNSFIEAGFIPVGLKFAPPSFIGDEYASRRWMKAGGAKAATPHRLPLAPTIIMLKTLKDGVEEHIRAGIAAGLYLVPSALYDKA